MTHKKKKDRTLWERLSTMSLEELRCMFYKISIKRLSRKREFVFRFDYYDDNSRGHGIDETNVVQYEFINQGNTVININGLLLQPLVNQSGFAFPFDTPPNRILLPIRENEMDVTVYRFKFLAQVSVPPFEPDNNLLLVISKVKADIATNKKG